MSAESFDAAVAPLLRDEKDAGEVRRLYRRHLQGQGAGFNFEEWMDPDDMPARTHEELPR